MQRKDIVIVTPALADANNGNWPHAMRSKLRVILQSCSARQPLDKTATHLRALMVGHLREEKLPRTYFDAARLLALRTDILLDHVGAADALSVVLATAQAWLGQCCSAGRFVA